MIRGLRLLTGVFASVWLHGGLLGLLWIASPWIALFDASAADPAETDSPVSVTADFAQDGDLTASEDLNPDPITGGVSTLADTPPSAEPPAADPRVAAKREDARAEPAAASAAANEKGADQVQAKGRKSKNKPPCPAPIPEITTLGPNVWAVEREFIDYYAGHLSELLKLAGTWPHKDARGKPDGFRVGLPRCSVLRQGGLRSGDVVQDINGIRINNLLQAVAAWFDLRNDTHVVVNLARGGKRVSLEYQIEPQERRRRR